MSEIVHDLLKEVEELETATKELEKTSSQADAYHQELLNKKSEHQNNIQLLNLEAIKAAQDAATLSQQAAQASLKQGQKLKAEIFEISEANFNWRQAIRNASKEIKSAKSSMTIMLIVAIILSLSAAGAAGYFAYAMQKQNAQFKGEVIDMVTTEHALLKKNFALKVDELAYVVENMNSSVSKIMATQAEGNFANKNTTSMPTTESINQDIDNQLVTEDMPATPEKISLPVENNQPKPGDEQTKQENNHSGINHEQFAKIQTSLQKLETQVEHNNKLLNNLSSVVSKPEQKVTQTSNSSSTTALDNSKKLASLSWLIRQQSKKITALDTAINQLKMTDSTASVKQMNLMVNKVQQQHSEVQNQLQSIRKSLQELTELSKEPPPYSYKAK